MLQSVFLSALKDEENIGLLVSRIRGNDELNGDIF